MHLINCIVYIDLNMVRAGVVSHPEDWEYGGYALIQNVPSRNSLIDYQRLQLLLQLDDLASLQALHRTLVDQAIKCKSLERDSKWTESVAIGSRTYVEQFDKKCRPKARSLHIVGNGETFELRRRRP